MTEPTLVTSRTLLVLLESTAAPLLKLIHLPEDLHLLLLVTTDSLLRRKRARENGSW